MTPRKAIVEEQQRKRQWSTQEPNSRSDAGQLGRTTGRKTTANDAGGCRLVECGASRVRRTLITMLSEPSRARGESPDRCYARRRWSVTTNSTSTASLCDPPMLSQVVIGGWEQIALVARVSIREKCVVDKCAKSDDSETQSVSASASSVASTVHRPRTTSYAVPTTIHTVSPRLLTDHCAASCTRTRRGDAADDSVTAPSSRYLHVDCQFTPAPSR